MELTGARLIEHARGAVDAAATVCGEFAGQPCRVAAGEPLAVHSGELPRGLAQSGCLLVIGREPGAIVLAVTAASRLLADPAGSSSEAPAGREEADAGWSEVRASIERLARLAGPLAAAIVPPDVGGKLLRVGHVEQLAESVLACTGADDAVVVPLELAVGDEVETAWLVGPLADVEPLRARVTAIDELLAEAGRASARDVQSDVQSDVETRLDELPPYTRSLLKIRVPVRVKLGATRQPIQRILSMGPGTIVQLSKSCDELLSLEVGDCEVAVGEAVKVGEYFGLRVTSMVLPQERLESLRAQPRS